ncbi:DUF6389 family protein [Microbacterium gilvum]|uniref:Immunity protein Imm1 n=1 Tax=Microbacterium gilvum TaxID=1336204 RepID=A0ABP9ATD5_9MICO
MDHTEYQSAVLTVLDGATTASSACVAAIHRATVNAGADVLIEVFVDQDVEGPFSVWVRFEGDHAVALDRELGDERELFSVIWGEEGWEPPVPPRPAGWSRQRLTEAIVAAVAAWVGPLIPAGTPAVHWEVAPHDGIVDGIAVGPVTA